MKHGRFVALLLLFAASSAFSVSPSQAPAVTAPIITPTPTPPRQRTLKPEDYAQLRDVDEPNISPDGNSVVYVVKKADMEKDKLPGNLWLAKWDGSENRALTYGTKASHIRAGVRMENGSRFFPAARTKTKLISSGSGRAAAAKRKSSPT